MKAPDPLTMAHACLKFWRHGGTVSPHTKKSLERLAKALDTLDPAARFLLLGQVSVEGVAEKVKVGLKYLKSNLKQGKDDILYRLAVQYLVQDYELKFGRSPLTEGHLEEFQIFAAAVMNDYDAPVPSERHVRDAKDWLRRAPSENRSASLLD